MKSTQGLFSAISIGIILGVASTTVLFVASFLALIPWAFAGIGIGAYTTERKDAFWQGLVYGFALVVAFLISGDKNFHPVYIIFILVFGIIGAGCGMILSLIGYALRMKLHQAK